MIDLGVGGSALVEPDNDTLTGALVEIEMLTQDEAHERMGVQNVGDFERVARTVSGVTLLAAASCVPRALRCPASASLERSSRCRAPPAGARSTSTPA